MIATVTSKMVKSRQIPQRNARKTAAAAEETEDAVRAEEMETMAAREDKAEAADAMDEEDEPVAAEVVEKKEGIAAET